MEGHVGDGFEAFLQNLQMDFSPSPAISSTTSSAPYVSSRPAFPPSIAFSQNGVQGHQSPSSPSSGLLETPRSFGKPPNFRSSVSNVAEKPIQRGRHRRAHSEIAFRLPDQLMVDHDLVLDNADLSVSDETREDLFSTYLDMKSSNLRDKLPLSSTFSELSHAESSPIDDVLNEYDSVRNMQEASGGIYKPPQSRPPRHHHSLSMDGSLAMAEEFLMSDLDFLEAKKAVNIDQLAELAATDPRRAKRILANRQSAARSKERKMKYIAELEQKVQKLQTEATSLSAQLAALQRDTSGLSTQNSELKLRLQAMEQQAHLRDALNDTLKEEVRWLKSAAAQMGIGNGHNFNIDTSHQASKHSF
ncbi:hypothetical protein L7F22_013048 [Adiantum nelumboides]|nr:hypothetical protein [Adiantum nelumboides]